MENQASKLAYQNNNSKKKKDGSFRIYFQLCLEAISILSRSYFIIKLLYLLLFLSKLSSYYLPNTINVNNFAKHFIRKKHNKKRKAYLKKQISGNSEEFDRPASNFVKEGCGHMVLLQIN